MNRLQDDLLAEVFRELPLHERSAAQRAYSKSSSVIAMLIHLMCQMTIFSSECRVMQGLPCMRVSPLAQNTDWQSRSAGVAEALCGRDCD
jgi:hypothetical protein